jgi:hypothetical protein
MVMEVEKKNYHYAFRYKDPTKTWWFYEPGFVGPRDEQYSQLSDGWFMENKGYTLKPVQEMIQKYHRIKKQFPELQTPDEVKVIQTKDW